MVIIAEDDFSEKIPDNFIWMTLHQLAYFNRFNNYLNIQARCLLAAIKFI
jgi:oxidase EvaA